MLASAIGEMLTRKKQLDKKAKQANNMVSYEEWMIEAIELLLKVALDNERERKP